MKNTKYIAEKWLPTSVKEVQALGWEWIDVILFSGDAYIDHPSFGASVIARVIESCGLRVAVVPQPNWRDDLRDFRKLGPPRLFFGVTAGNMDSMINHYTAAKRLRSDDAYSPGGASGFRPDNATVVYTRILKTLFPDIPVVIGGIEASMRRLAHYDYWKDSLEPSVLISSGADLLVYGMGERTIARIVERMKNGEVIKGLYNMPQIAFICANEDEIPSPVGVGDKHLHAYSEAKASRKAYAENFVLFEKNSNTLTPFRLIEKYDNSLVVVNPPLPPAGETEADAVYALPYNYAPHPRYAKKDSIPAWEMIKFSVNIHRGCFGGCSFCAIAAHQGKFISSRSEKSVMKEVERISRMEGFKGYLTDLGGPSANMYGMKGRNREKCEKCNRPSCIWPAICNNLDTSHKRLLDLYRKTNALPYIKKAFIGSGVRYDLFLSDSNPQAGRDEEQYLSELVVEHTGGRLKVAPEHTDEEVLKLMRKRSFSFFKTLRDRFNSVVKRNGLKYELIPYFISSHPGTTEKKMSELACELKEAGLYPEQVQDFTPTPMTYATAMFYLGYDPYTGKSVYVARSVNEKRKQKDYFFSRREKGGAGKMKRPGKAPSRSYKPKIK